MANASKPCKECGGEVKLTTLGSFRGEEGPVAVIVNGMPALVCDQNHKRFLHNEFVANLIDLIADPERVAPQPPAARRGFFRKRYHCSECGAELPWEPARKAERGLDASFKNAASFRVVVQVAVHKCAGCGREQVQSNDEVARSALKAVALAFRAEGLRTDR